MKLSDLIKSALDTLVERATTMTTTTNTTTSSDQQQQDPSNTTTDNDNSNNSNNFNFYSLEDQKLWKTRLSNLAYYWTTSDAWAAAVHDLLSTEWRDKYYNHIQANNVTHEPKIIDGKVLQSVLLTHPDLKFAYEFYNGFNQTGIFHIRYFDQDFYCIGPKGVKSPLYPSLSPGWVHSIKAREKQFGLCVRLSNRTLPSLKDAEYDDDDAAAAARVSSPNDINNNDPSSKRQRLGADGNFVTPKSQHGWD